MAIILYQHRSTRRLSTQHSPITVTNHSEGKLEGSAPVSTCRSLSSVRCSLSGDAVRWATRSSTGASPSAALCNCVGGGKTHACI